MKTMLKRGVLVTSLFAAGALLAYGPGLGGFGFSGHHGWGGHMTGMGHGPMAFLDGNLVSVLDETQQRRADGLISYGMQHLF
jgi:hypothetical protein